MANPEHLEILKQGIEAWNEWRDENPDVRPDLSRASLDGLDLRGALPSRAALAQLVLSGANLLATDLLIGADLGGAELTGARLGYADLSYASLAKADLAGARLIGSKLRFVDLSEANLRGVDLMWADLDSANLKQTNLHEADLRSASLLGAYLGRTEVGRAMVGRTVFGDLDLRGFVGLDTVRHFAPSAVDAQSLVRSKGAVPEAFLRGAGVPEEFINYMRSPVGRAIEYYSCFIGYSSRDKHFADRLLADLQSKGVRTWCFEETARWGEKVWAEIDQGIRLYDKLILICSHNSLQSVPVLREVNRALGEEARRKGTVLFPITIDSYLYDEWEHELKSDILDHVVGDFCRWESDAQTYTAAFQRLLRDLSSNTAPSRSTGHQGETDKES